VSVTIVLPIELSSLDVDTIFSDSHPQVFHRENRSPLVAALSASAVAGPRSTKREVFCFRSTVLAALCTAGHCCALRSSASGEAAHRIVTCRVGCADAGVLVCVGSDICDEFLGCKRKQAG
jgi:hypothetical protein